MTSTRKTSGSMSDEELEKLILENGERVKKIMREHRDQLCDDLENDGVEAFESIKHDVKKTKKAAKENAKQMTDAFFDPEVQKHFMNVGIEMAMGFESLLRAMPKPKFAEDAMNEAESARDNVQKAYCSTNPNCQKKGKDNSGKVKKIEIE
jgi:hypothetical protein